MFKHLSNRFQSKLKADISNIKKSKEIIVSADKTNNLYKVNKETYSNLLLNNITQEYKKIHTDEITNANKEASNIAKKLNLDDRIEIQSKAESFITFKDHKENFPGRIQCRLINPAKSNIGIISKQILQQMNDTVRSHTQLQQ